MEKIDLVVSLLREHDRTSWVADQVASTFAQGVSMNVKDAQADIAFYSLEPSDLTSRERQKREKYETTRPYTDGEKLELLAEALETLYIDLPAIQAAGLEALQDLGGGGASIEFAAPDEPEQGLHGYTIELRHLQERRELLNVSFEQFRQELMK